MTPNERKNMIFQAKQLYDFGITVEAIRESIRKLVQENVPYNSPAMRAAVASFLIAEAQWKQLEQEHLDYRSKVVRR